jgi:acetyl-CoA carboxylase biotin carboxyl carrier protein
MRLDYDQISEILKIIDSSSCEEFMLEVGDIKLVLRRRSGNGAPPPPFIAASIHASPTAAPQSTAAPQLRSEPSQIHKDVDVVRAPMVGTFFCSPSPDAPPFVEIGSRVKKGDTLCIVEVMKLFTTIAAERDGTIAEICVENAALVEYGQVLFVMKPA